MYITYKGFLGLTSSKGVFLTLIHGFYMEKKCPVISHILQLYVVVVVT